MTPTFFYNSYYIPPWRLELTKKDEMKNYLIISLLLLSVGVSQKMLNKKVMIEEKLPDSDQIIVYPPNSDEPYSGVVYWYGGVAQLNHQTYLALTVLNALSCHQRKTERYQKFQRS